MLLGAGHGLCLSTHVALPMMLPHMLLGVAQKGTGYASYGLWYMYPARCATLGLFPGTTWQ
jgi:hypothetical protein